MNKPIIIDGVDVSECAYMYDNEDLNYMCQDGIGTCICRENKNCYYKQLQRLKKALEEVREIAEKYYLSDKKLLATGIEINPYGAIIEIQDKINEVLGD